MPTTNDWVEETDVDGTKDQERQQLDALSNTTGDGCGSSSKHALEDEVSPVGVIGIARCQDRQYQRRLQYRSLRSCVAIEVAWVYEVETTDRIG